MKLFGVKEVFISLCAVVFLVNCGGDGNDDNDNGSGGEEISKLSKKEELGKSLFFDTSLSSPEGMSCSTCHVPGTGFVDPNKNLPVSQGIHPTRFGNRNTPTAAYASFVPAFHFDANESLYVGGLFLDGRANNGLVDQAKGPFLNPLEMAMPHGVAVAQKVEQASYATLFKEVYGEDAFDDLNASYDKIADAIAAFESTELFHPFNSKYDDFLKGDANLTEQELRGLTIFKDKGECAECHIADISEDGTHPLFTDFTYDNLGVPANPAIPFYDLNATFNPDGVDFIDLGLGGVLNDVAENGKFRVPTLRNIAITGPYMHNGVFGTLREVVEFYNTRDTRHWPAPEVAENVNADELGDLNLTEQEVDDLVSFMETLTDNYKAEK